MTFPKKQDASHQKQTARLATNATKSYKKVNNAKLSNRIVGIVTSIWHAI